MQIQVNTSNGIDNKEALERWADTEIQQQLQRFRDDVTRVEVHLSDENHEKAGERDKCCVMEARLAHHQPLAVKQHASSMDEAFRGASDKLKRLLDSTLGRLHNHRDRESIRRDGGAGLVAE
ncbi:ribosomal subunit Interface protein [Variovorax paradoxus]|jgi:ribosome-associated translation inhibitor RaiA|uniref:HPF/RaiA family ribosome-associated protein n=1 Tax=Variovorax TaxID=34072 RepID=UPI0006E540B6|nr:MULTISPECIES: HPF/RaiA family ribosome-associated protein [unclassified Variovorax]KPU93898.1 ribosomal subunit Interface protein [Variovorax paradoxus]KPV03016.1 ribosomal subunit Interface protein [Variovorax paradoxus]KPV04225.1 ribosomal subunit Interface protein [Variovorax paradoxus]KPV17307.1 ribosomal subunit Interface protein [Variovorax paradoxus]KPV26237.1 ribosomal subunit Interface protein [Variovorax paradoxus]